MTVHNTQLVYSNRQDIALTLLAEFKIWLVRNCQTEADHLNIKIATALLLYNACTLIKRWKYVSHTIINLRFIPGDGNLKKIENGGFGDQRSVSQRHFAKLKLKYIKVIF